jgi:hypothetical protein
MLVACVTPILIATGGRPAATKYSSPAFEYHGDENFFGLGGVVSMCGVNNLTTHKISDPESVKA